MSITVVIPSSLDGLKINSRLMYIKYNETIEVNAQQYSHLIVTYRGMIAHRAFGGKYYIRVWDVRCAKYIEKYLIG